MATINEAPIYDVVNPDPSIRDVLSAMRPADWALVVGCTLAGIPIGFLMGAPGIRRPIMMHAVWVNFSGSMGVGVGLTTYRLLGFKENKTEVRRFGAFRKMEDMPYARAQQVWDQ
ncbi:hypothetical protein FVE85_7394 [Porphyridium purpureum]|uniref:NADH-ubiquinone oxidoreductase 21kDa subunit N-terminal domain-containing protein n=1 Tax=Porphyridium purpureum TaxID=35688 RepID=A0A5J4Z713_PORPP|nr:hypothetical protein FVE85_7394 [Porphyridium purpureum]|eukprot:POR5316..scf295_1